MAVETWKEVILSVFYIKQAPNGPNPCAVVINHKLIHQRETKRLKTQP